MDIETLPPKQEVETKAVLKLALTAERKLGELKGVIKIIPNQAILLNLLPIQEAQMSSEIENIITTTDELYRSKIDNNIVSPVKEVRNYEAALLRGFEIVKEKSLLTSNHICEIQRILLRNDAGFRKLPGTHLRNNVGEIVYTPPQEYRQIKKLMENLSEFINDPEMSDINPLVKMALIHHQFETIHPFYDGNGRTGRIINILYLQLQGLLDLPVLYLSRFIIDYKSEYYRLLQGVRGKNKWEEWIIYILDGVISTATETIELVEKITDLMLKFKKTIREKHEKIYSQDLINLLFKFPYTKAEFIANDLRVHRHTANRYLKILEKENLLQKMTIGRSHYYINRQLIDTAVLARKESREARKESRKALKESRNARKALDKK